MYIRHRTQHTADQLARGDRQFAAVRPGVFQVPTDLALELIHTPDWEPYIGEEAYEVRGVVVPGDTEAELEADGGFNLEKSARVEYPALRFEGTKEGELLNGLQNNFPRATEPVAADADAES